ncbi:carboxypeptidase regulatory-like domain-containing protein [Asanoa sp. NPDC049518]|uniref:carboxypeptidase regulatory-like domain-containing protein n=1 Tax=unclassified Asanoa TaxID=2685164 RepID=UPI003424CBF4
MRPSGRRRATAALVAAVLLGGMAAGATPAQAAANGSIGGHLSLSSGAPAGDILVQAYDPETYEGRGFTTSAADGSYQLDGLAAGNYIVGFFGSDIAEQYFDRKDEIFDADPIAVTDGRSTLVNQDLFGAGFLTGRFTDPTGAPLDNSLVRVYRADDESYAGAAGTDSDGTFRIAVRTGTYLVSFEPDADLYQEQYVPGKLAPAAAQRFVVTEGQETSVNDTALAAGRLSGRVTQSDGTPARDVQLYASPFGGSGGGESATTNDNGDFSIPKLLAGQYMVEFWVGYRTEYFDRTADPEEADPVTVVGGQDNRFTPSLLPTGSVRVRAVDAISGITIRDFCASGECSDSTGQLLLTGLTEGRQSISVRTESNYISRDVDVTVRTGQTTDLVVRLLPGAKITTTVVDKATGQPLSNVCLTAYRPRDVSIQEGMTDDQCSDAAGKVTLSRLEAGDYRLFAEPRNKAYGRQWVTANGGSGDERQAVTVKATTGKTATAPQVKIDRAGTIRGRVTDAATGAPIYAGVGVFTQSPGTGGGETTTDEDGRFEIDGLGPYRWPLHYNGYENYASSWTGGAVTRYATTGTQVTAGTVATADLALTKGVTVRGNVLPSRGTAQGGRISVLNTTTGDYVGTVDFEGAAYQLLVQPEQEIRFIYSIRVDGTTYRSEAAKLAPAAPGGPLRPAITVPAGGVTADLIVPIP